MSCDDGLRCWNFDFATSWAVQGSNPGKGQRYSGSFNHPDRLWGPHSLLFNGYRNSFLGVKHPKDVLDTHLYLGPMLRLSGALSLFLIYAFLAWATGRTLTFFTEVSVYRNFNSHSMKIIVSTQYTLRNEIRLFTSQTVLKRNFTLWVRPTLTL